MRKRPKKRYHKQHFMMLKWYKKGQSQQKFPILSQPQKYIKIKIEYRLV